MKNQTFENQNNDGADSGAIEAPFVEPGQDSAPARATGINVSGASVLSGGVNDTVASKAGPESPTGPAPATEELATCALCFRQGVYGVDVIEVGYRDWLGHDTTHLECKDYEACLDRRGY
jgi:hypothetical protein